jgi:hypothetical protein
VTGIVYAASLGDSYIFNQATGNTADEFHPAFAQRILNAAGAPNLRIRNYGVSGNTSANAISRMHAMFPEKLVNGAYAFEVPRFVELYIGANDTIAANQSTVQAAPAPTTTAFAVGAGKAAVMAAPGSWLIWNGQTRQVQSVSGDTITFATAFTGTPVAGDAVSYGTQKNIEEIGNYCKARGCTNILVDLQHYLDYAGGDTVSTPMANLVALRTAQQAAATTLGATVVDFYTPMRARIVAGTDAQNFTQTLVVTGVNTHSFTVTAGTGVNYTAGQTIVIDGRMGVIDKVIGDLIRLRVPLRYTPPTGAIVTANWHSADNNTHLNPYGQYLLGTYVAAAVQAAGWSLT